MNRGRSQRRRGKKAEYRVRDFIRSAGYPAERVPLSGSSWLKGDVVATIAGKQYTFEVKRRQTIPKKWLTLFANSWLEIDGQPYWAGTLSYFLANYEAIRTSSLADVTPAKLPKGLIPLLQQAERENSALVLVPAGRREFYILFSQAWLLGRKEE